LKPGTKLILILLGAAVFAVAAYQGFIHVYYRMYNGYKQYIDESRGIVYEEGTPFKALAGGNNVPGMVLVAQSGVLELYTDTETTNVAVYDKRTGDISYVCPPEADFDPVASNLNKSLMKSPLTIEFFNARRTPGSYNAYDFAIKEEQVEIESIADGIRYIYTLGDLTVTTGIVPLYIHVNRLAFFAGQVESDMDRQRLEMAYEESNETPDGFLALRSGALSFASVNRLTAILESVGYTQEDCLADSLASGMEGAVKISFEIPLEYRLDGDSLVVSIPTSRIVENGGAKIDKIHLLRCFGAAGTEDNGYVLVPDGSGSLIYFNNNKVHAEDYSQFIYGQDPLTNDYLTLGNAERARLPVFGIYKEGGPNIFAQIGEGASFSQVNAGIAGRNTSYNYVCPTFVIRGSGSLLMFGITGNEGELPVVEADLYQANLTVRYSFLPKEYDGYSGMARYYREALEDAGVLGARAEQGDIPLYLDLIGSVTGTKFFMSVQYQGVIPMTTYKQAAEIVDIFHDAGITRQVVNYQGWFNRGYYHDAANRITHTGRLGGKKQFEALSSKLEEHGGKLYADVIFQEVPYPSRRYNWPMENSRYYGVSQIAFSAHSISPLSYLPWGLGYSEAFIEYISPKFLPRYVNAFTKRIDGYDITGVSLRDLGSQLQSDRKRTEFIDREHALSVVLAQLEKIDDLDKDVMVSGGNLYALPFADDLINVPLFHSDFFIVDTNVPFYQMVVHGYIPYAGYAVNFIDSYDETGMALKLLEYGSSPHFTLTYEQASEMKYTGLNKFYGTFYQNWTGSAVALYQTVNPVLSRVSGSVIQRHEITPEGLRCVTYDCGTQIIVNYSGAPVPYGDVTVPAQGFTVREGVAA
jgi:hypothetical protein